MLSEVVSMIKEVRNKGKRIYKSNFWEGSSSMFYYCNYDWWFYYMLNKK